MLRRGFAALGMFAWSCSIMTNAAHAQNTVTAERDVPYLGTPHHIRLSNGTVELILSTGYGPRIVRYAFAGSDDAGNAFATIPPQGNADPAKWHIRGGHRLWHAPEEKPRTYQPDNDPIEARVDGNTVRLIQPVEKNTGIQKEMTVTLDPAGSHVTVVHTLTNRGLFAVETACWALSVMNTDGTAVFPQEPYRSHDESLLPARPLVLWPYTDMTDPRWTWGKRFLLLRRDSARQTPQKVGLLNKEGWAAYARPDGILFLKRFAHVPGRTYPDFGSSTETFTRGGFLEVETLGPIERVEPGQAITHTEHWWLYRNVPLGKGEDEIAGTLQPILEQTRGTATPGG